MAVDGAAAEIGQRTANENPVRLSPYARSVQANLRRATPPSPAVPPTRLFPTPEGGAVIPSAKRGLLETTKQHEHNQGGIKGLFEAARRKWSNRGEPTTTSTSSVAEYDAVEETLRTAEAVKSTPEETGLAETTDTITVAEQPVTEQFHKGPSNGAMDTMLSGKIPEGPRPGSRQSEPRPIRTRVARRTAPSPSPDAAVAEQPQISPSPDIALAEPEIPAPAQTELTAVQPPANATEEKPKRPAKPAPEKAGPKEVTPESFAQATRNASSAITEMRQRTKLTKPPKESRKP